MRPHNLPFVMLGAGLLWFGWFGFNAGSALAADDLAGVAFINTIVATCAAMLGWLIVEQIRDGKPPRSAPRPAWSPAWSRSPRPAGYVSPARRDRDRPHRRRASVRWRSA